MKKSQLQKLIREAIDEVLNEESPSEKDAKQKELAAIDAKIKALNVKKSDVASGREEVAEGEIDEMSRGPIKYKLTAGYEDKIAELPYANSEKRMKWVNGIVDYVDEMGAAATTTIAQEKFGVPQPRIADYVRDMIRLGILEPEQEGVVPQFMRQTDDGDDARDEPEFMDPEGGIAGDMSDEEVDAGFPDLRGGEEEPEAGEIEKGNVSAASMSDEDYEAFMQYTDLEGRLAKLKSDILKTKRSRGGVAGDIGDGPSSSLDSMRALKDKLQKKMNDLLANSEYLQKRQAKITGKEYIKPEPEETEEEPLDEWTKNRMQYYAGIKK
jgi:hypothetical protein